jgi:hypothetical protein
MGEKDLESILREKTGGDILLHEIEAIKNEAIPLLKEILVTFSEFTPHDMSHSELVLKRMNDVIPDSLKEELRSYEIYFLIVSAYLHDLGMAKLGYLDLPEALKNNSEKLKEYIRDNHNIRSEKYIIDNYNKLKISDINQARIIGKICRGHRKESLDNDILFDPRQTYKDEIINVPFLASILRVCDELDLTFERIPLIVYEMGLINNPSSKSEWEKHLSVEGVALDPEGQLRCTATCKDPDIHRALKQIESKINEQLEIIHNHLYHYRGYSSCIPWKFKLKIKAEGYKYYDFKFSLKENEILKLLIGTGFYKRNEECIRELLKNCVDTCRYNSRILRQEEGTDYNYQPKIVFELTNEKDKLIVSDNGFGMDKYIIENYFTKIGKSFYKSPDFLEKENDFSPVSELGIGFLSCFMIANKIEIETKTIHDDPMLIEIDNISNYFLVRDGNRSLSGTKITLYLKENARQIKIKEELEYYARHIEIPIHIKLPSGQYVIKIERNKPYFKLGNIEEESLFIKSDKLNNVDFEGTVGILFTRRIEKFYLSHRIIKKNIYSNPNEKAVQDNAIICYNGVLVCNRRPIPEWLNGYVVFQDINIKNNILDFILSRNQIISNEKFASFSNSLESLTIHFLIKVLETMEWRSREEINDFIIGITDSDFNHTTEGTIDYYYEERSEETIKEDADLLDFLKKFYSFSCFSDQGFDLMKYDEILKLDKQIKILKYSDLNYHYIQDMLFNCGRLDYDNLYIMPMNHDLVDAMIKHLFGPESINFYDLFEVETVGGILGEIFPDRVNIINIKNLNTDRLITHVIEDGPIELINVNINNRFVSLICSNKEIIYNQNKNLVKELFRYLLQESKINMNRILTEQKVILKWFKEQNLIDEDEFITYLLSPEDLEGSTFPFRTENML